LFFGVPNLGLRQGQLKEITAWQLNAQLIQNLELDTEGEATQYLKELKTKFIRCCRKQNPPFRIVSYYEQKKTPTVKVSSRPLSGRHEERNPANGVCSRGKAVNCQETETPVLW
jgi:hypothetical protein